MTTKNMLQKLNEKSIAIRREVKSLGITPSSLGPLFSLSGTILRTRSLVDAGIEESLSEIFLPHVVLSFVPSLIANSICKRYTIEPKDVLIYLIGLVSSIFVCKSSFAMFMISEIPYISKFFSLLKLKNSTEDTFTMMSWIITNELSGMFLNKLILKKKMKVSLKDMVTMFLTYSGVLFLRYYNLNDYNVIILAFIIPFSAKAIEYLKKKEKTKAVTKEEEVPRRPRRKASVSAQSKSK